MLKIYNNLNYFCWKKNKINKIKTNNIKIYLDKNLKDKIYVLDSGLNANSFMREKQFNIFNYSKNLNNVSINFDFYNFWGLLYFYPTKYKINNYKKSKSLQNKLITNLKFINIEKNSFKKLSSYYSKNLLLWFIKNRNVLRFFLIKKILKKYKRFTYFVDNKGLLFKLNKKFLKKNLELSLFKGKIKKTATTYSKVVLSMIKAHNKNKYLPSKLYLYFHFSKYLFLKLRDWFENLHWIFHKFRRYEKVKETIKKKNKIKQKKNKKLIKLRPMPQQEFRSYYKNKYLENIYTTIIMLKNHSNKKENFVFDNNLKSVLNNMNSLYTYYSLINNKEILINSKNINIYENKLYKTLSKKDIFNNYMLIKQLNSINMYKNNIYYENTKRFSNKDIYLQSQVDNKIKRYE